MLPEQRLNSRSGIVFPAHGGKAGHDFKAELTIEFRFARRGDQADPVDVACLQLLQQEFDQLAAYPPSAEAVFDSYILNVTIA